MAEPRERASLLVLGASAVLTARAGSQGARGGQLDRLELISAGGVAIVGERIVAVGPSKELAARYEADHVLDARSQLVTPGLVDPHTHLVHAGSRRDEWETTVTGRPSASLAQGIMSTVACTRDTSSTRLRQKALRDLDVALAHGTTTLEAKSGYGLDHDTELRLLEVATGLEHAVDVASTYLGAHVLPPEFDGRRADYIDLVMNLVGDVPATTTAVDVCCDPVGFTAAECRRVATAAREHNLALHVHADQTGDAGGAALAAAHGALSADHLDAISPAGVHRLAQSSTVAVLLPGVTHHMLETVPGTAGASLEPPRYGNRPKWARALVDAGACVALSSDYNPGTCPSISMPTMMGLAARLFRLSTAEIWYMVTINAAHALGRADDVGSLEPGKFADLVIWGLHEPGEVIYRFGVNMVGTVVKRGRVVHESSR